MQSKAKLMKRQQRKERRILAGITERVRAAPAVDGMQYRSSMLGQPDEQARTIVATLSTEQPVAMYDYRTRAVIDEVLLASGGQFPERMPLLDDHSRYGANSVMGSVRNAINSGDRWRGTLSFATNAGPDVDQIWEKVRQGHITDVSVGYRYGEGDYVDIAPGQTRKINGREFTASRARALRVVTKWSARETSITPIGADDQAKIGRSGGIPNSPDLGFGFEIGAGDFDFQSVQRTEEKMDKLLQFLHARGMDQSITEQAAALAWAQRNLAGDLLDGFQTLCRQENVQFEIRSSAVHAPATVTSTPSAQPVAPTLVASTATLQRSEADEFAIARERASYISQVGEGVPENVRSQAMSEGWDVARINREFSTSRQQRSAPLSGQAPAGHVVDRTLNARTLQAAILMRSGVELDHPMIRSQQAQHVFNDRSLFGFDSHRQANGDWLVRHARNLERGGRTEDDESARAVDRAYMMQRMSMVDICRAALDIEGVRYDSYDRDEIIQRSFSTATLNAVFTTNFAAQMLMGFMDAPDTTGPWTKEDPLPNFQTVERFQLGKSSKLKKMERHQKSEDVTVEAMLESYKLARYAGNFVVDEMDIIDDRFGAIDAIAPRDMGEAARVLRPDLVYSILLGNPTMAQDSTALFATAHGNYTASGAALSRATIDAAKSAMASQTSNGRLLDIRAQYLIVPETKAWAAEQIIGSAEVRGTGSDYGTMNPAKGKFTVISDPRLDVGVADPATGTVNAGEPGSFFLATANGRYGINVGMLQGTGGAPVVRKYNLTEGRAGFGWTCIMYAAAKAVGFQGLSKQKA
jgi:hypothetical protein